MLVPTARLEPLTVNVARPAETLAVPREVLPSIKATLPAGIPVPEAARTVAVRTVDALCAITAGTAVRLTEVPISGAVDAAMTATAAVADRLARIALP